MGLLATIDRHLGGEKRGEGLVQVFTHAQRTAREERKRVERRQPRWSLLLSVFSGYQGGSRRKTRRGGNVKRKAKRKRGKKKEEEEEEEMLRCRERGGGEEGGEER